jgi:hypothetical protein
VPTTSRQKKTRRITHASRGAAGLMQFSYYIFPSRSTSISRLSDSDRRRP